MEEFNWDLFKHDFGEDNFTIHKHMIKEQTRLYENLIIQVLTNYLQRKPTIDDFKKVSLGHIDLIPEQELMSYDGIMLGYIRTSFENNKFTITFSEK